MKARQKHKQAEKFEFIFKIQKYCRNFKLTKFQEKLLKVLKEGKNDTNL